MKIPPVSARSKYFCMLRFSLTFSWSEIKRKRTLTDNPFQATTDCSWKNSFMAVGCWRHNSFRGCVVWNFFRRCRFSCWRFVCHLTSCGALWCHWNDFIGWIVCCRTILGHLIITDRFCLVEIHFVPFISWSIFRSGSCDIIVIKIEKTSCNC